MVALPPRNETDRSAFHERLVDQYAGQRNFYALAYDQDEVIDSVRQFPADRKTGLTDRA